MALSAIRCLGLDVEVILSSTFIQSIRSLNQFHLQIRLVNLFEKEQLKEDFIKINPQHTLPTLDDNGFILTESRAIAIYLVEKYFPNGHPLYPKDVEQRARINQRLQFDATTLYPRIRAIQVKSNSIIIIYYLINGIICHSGQYFAKLQQQFQRKIVNICSMR